MEVEGRDFMNTPPVKIVRFGGGVVEMLEKHGRVSVNLVVVGSAVPKKAKCLD